MNLTKNSKYLLFSFVFIGLFLRLLYFKDLTFGYDQARDALESISILKNKDIKIIGPTTDIKGLFHSPLFWYIVSPFYFFSKGNPEIARIPMIVISLLNIAFIYYLALKLLKDKKIALVSSLFMAVSFEAIQYGRWLSNPPPALLTTAVFFYGLWLTLNGKKLGLPLMVAFWSLSVDFQFFLVYQLIFILFAFVYLIVKNKNIVFQSIKKYYWLYASSLLFFSFYILSELKFRFLGLISLLGFIAKHDQGSSPLWPKLINFSNSLIRNVSNFVSGGNIFVARVFIVLLTAYLIFNFIKKTKNLKIVIFLFCWFISPVLIYPLEKNNSYFLNIGNLYPLILLVSLMIFDAGQMFKKGKLVFLILAVGAVVLTNILMVIKEDKNGEVLFSVQNKQILNDEKKVIDYLYKDSRYKQYAINTVTNPLLVNSTWAYVFDWYGRRKYKYMPHWFGYPLDSFGKEIKFNEDSWQQTGQNLYLIIEPTPGIPEDYIKAYKKYENTRSRLVETIKIGNFTVEKRILINNNYFLREDLDKLL